MNKNGFILNINYFLKIHTVALQCVSDGILSSNAY